MKKIQPSGKDIKKKIEIKKELHPHTANPPGNHGRGCSPEYERRKRDPGPYSGH